MNIVENIRTFLSKKENNQQSQAPEGFCPNCWGRQEYGGRFVEAVQAKGITSSSLSAQKGWIRAYVEENLSGILLRGRDRQASCCSGR